jgi:hypothetical protein
VTHEVTITWQASRGGWFGRVLFAALATVILIVAGLASLIVLASMALGILAILAIFLWKVRMARGVSWRALWGKSSRRW